MGVGFIWSLLAAWEAARKLERLAEVGRQKESNLLKIDMISMAARILMGALECKVTGAEVAGTG